MGGWIDDISYWVYLVLLLWFSADYLDLDKLSGANPWRKLVSVISQPTIAFHLWVESWTVSPIYIDMSTGVIMQVLLGQPDCWDFCGCNFPVISREHSRFNCPGPLCFKIFLSTLAWFPWALDIGLHCRCQLWLHSPQPFVFCFMTYCGFL